jgi:D-amino peptidase
MKILISADMEGATGVTWPADCEPGTEQWQRCRRMFTSDVNAAVAGFNEAHATMRNLLLEELDSRAVMLTGRHKDLSMVEGIQHGDVDGVAFVGYHAAAGAEGVLAHTYLPNSVTSVRVNGASSSEGRLNSFVAAEYGVPVVLITGDDRTCADAAGYAPDAVAVAVKDCVSRYAAVCRPPAVTAVAIRDAAATAAALAGRVAPLSGQEFTVQVDVDAAQLAQAAAIVPGVQRIGDRAVEYSATSAYEMIRSFKVVTTMISAAVEADYG